MATITMESEEYDEYLALKEKVKELEEQNTRLLLNADKSVSVIHQTVITERMHLKKDVNSVLEAVDRFFNQYNNTRYLDMSYDRKLQLIYDTFFTTAESSTVQKETVKEKGLEEYLQGVKDSLSQEVEEETKKQLNKIPVLEEANKFLTNKNLDLIKENTKIGDYSRQIDSLQDSIRSLVTENSRYIDSRREIQNILEKEKWNIFNYNDKKRKLRMVYWYGTT